MSQLNQGLTLFLSLLVEATPFLLLGVAFSSILAVLVDERKLINWVPKNPVLAAISGSLFGCLFPVCECGNVPVARRLLMQGAPSALAIGFLLAAPTVNPIVFWATWIAFRDQPSMVFWRVGLTILVSVIIACVFSVQKDLRPFLQPTIARYLPSLELKPSAAAVSPLLSGGTYLMQSTGTVKLDRPLAATLGAVALPQESWSTKARAILEMMLQEFRELGAVLVMGSAIAATVQVAIPREWILALGQGPITSILAMMLLAWVVSICSTVDSFFALSFASIFTSGSILAFLVFGPMIDLKNISLLLTTFKTRAVLYLFVLAAQLTFVFTLAVNLYTNW
ncbi:permease [Oscillatoria sp. CS-180]|uniref:permease n=1 Tax=Oscillatoria sp. CS-180 TaxID=3021720 RepID=UPI00232EDCB9|nr:permease [Oscillatoria sp. CS-180]MDB9527545.1 permease [Oscillatoria sp. CS-180]